MRPVPTYRVPRFGDRFFRLFAAVLFGSLFLYVLLKALLNEPMQDELATFSYYIQSGRPHNTDLPLDANNHLLNTYLCSVIYPITGGGDFFWMRLPNVLSFGLFFYSIYGLVRRFRLPALRYTSLAALTTITFLTDYFAYCRGYGLSMAFLAYSLLLLTQFLKGERDVYVPGIFAALLAAGANLSLLPLCLFVAGCFVLITFSRGYRNMRHLMLARVVPSLGFLAGLAYLLAFAFRLKASGALVWGGPDGLWGTTGSSLTFLVFRRVHDYYKYGIAALLVLLALHVGYRLVRERVQAFGRPDVVFPLLVLGMLAFLEAGNRFLGLLYPTDRGGLHLILLFLLAFVYVLDCWKISRLLHWALLYLPLLFALNLSLSNKVIDKDSIPTTIFARLRPLLRDDVSVLCNSHLAGSFNYHCLQNGMSEIVTAEVKPPTHSDLWITRTDMVEADPEGYRLIVSDPVSDVRVYRRKQPARRLKQLTGSRGGTRTIRQTEWENTYGLVPRFFSEPLQAGESIEIVVSGHLRSPATHSNLQLIVSATNMAGELTYYSATPLRMLLQDRKIDEPMHLNLKLDGLKGGENEFIAYFSSPSGEKLIIEDARYAVYLIR